MLLFMLYDFNVYLFTRLCVYNKIKDHTTVSYPMMNVQIIITKQITSKLRGLRQAFYITMSILLIKFV